MMFNHSMFILKESLLHFYHLKYHSEFVLIVFYRPLIKNGHANSSMADKKQSKLSLKDKNVVNEHTFYMKKS